MTQGFRVVILGAGFGGLEAARALARAPVEVTLVTQTASPTPSGSAGTAA